MAEENFIGAGQSAGLELWRIENMVPVKQPMVDGKFFSGDSYILLATTTSKRGNALEWNIHFWLGEDTTQDESGVAAYKSVELDDYLGGAPVQHREVQGHESELFLSYFKTIGLEYLAGGIDSGFNKVERDVFRTRLLQCKGKRSVRCSEVPCEAGSLNIGDVFILDMGGLQIFLYNGCKANRYEKVKGAEMAQKLNNERGARGSISFIHEDPHNSTFWSTLGGEIEVTNEGEDDEKHEVHSLADIKLYNIHFEDGELRETEVQRNSEGHFTRDMLTSDDAFILDAMSAVYVWVGKQANKEERRESMQIVSKFISALNRPSYTPVERVLEGGETSTFKSFFFQFDPPMTPRDYQTSNVASMPEEKQIDFAALHSRVDRGQAPIDDGTGKLTVWRVENFKKVEVPMELHGQFYGGDSYVLLYSYLEGRREAHIVYFWQGKSSTKDEIGASALLAKETDDELGGQATQVRVVQGKEPPHFRQLFKGRMIVHEGGKASGFHNSEEGDSYDNDGVSLFHVKGTNELNTIATQVGEVASSLNSMDCFVLLTSSHSYVWTGTGANEAERQIALSIGEILRVHQNGPEGSPPVEREIMTLCEGEEPEEFWTALGGQAEYPKTGPADPMPADPRLFHCTNAFGAFTVEEVPDFIQEDLLDDDVMLMDVGTTVFMWIGSGANAEERSKATTTAIEYNRLATDGRDPDTTVVQIHAGSEPGIFTQHFPGWDPKLAEKNKFIDPYEQKLQEIKTAQEKAAKEAAAQAPVEASTPTGSAALTPSDGFLSESTTFPYEELKKGCPVGVDPTKKEQYLSDEDFSQIFSMTRSEFDCLAAWKKKANKQRVGLF